MKLNIKLDPVTALYIRTSCNKQDSGADTQLNELTKFMAQSGIEDYVVYEDKAVSGAKDSRKEFNLMKQDIKKGKIKSVITYSLSRLGRDVGFLTEFRRLVDSKGIPLIMFLDGFSTKSPNGKFMFHIHSVMAEQARDDLVKSTIAGCELARKKGKVWGWKKTRPSEKIRKLHGQGASIRNIAETCGCSKGSVQAEIKLLKEGRPIIQWKNQ